ncbi:Transcriptional regulatory protein ZraR [Mariniblastus fucicola]|uniref:HTH-type transcriptional regulatory protein TyrR n=2 Tax=Mariniblastus fucicola TaxID=980251 RepID=A0A5B9PCW5_9BACT|nr:Transcriptional regulatory protein ZraR [Mariniblastus fucicola]
MLITQSSKIRVLKKLSTRVANSSASVLLSGESGTGKELFAQLIHHASQRSANAFVRVNCAALPESLIESELFGHEKGSFTDAVQARVGRFELANGGTLLLDEVTEIPLATQAKLLRVLEESEFERVGSNEPIQTDVRVIATSNRDLLQEVEKGNFRLDLYHRLNVVAIEIPALRERLIDVPLLAMHFVNRFQHENDIRIQGFTATAMQALSQHDWPGNVRELRNLVHRACILTTQSLIDVDCLDSLKSSSAPSQPVSMPDQWLHTKLADIEKQIIIAALQKYGSKRVVAEKLGVSTRTLTNKLRIYREQSDGDGDELLGRPKAA